MTESVRGKERRDHERCNRSNARTRSEASIRALEQQMTQLDEACYEALREARDASRRAGDLGLQAIEARVRLCAFIEHEPLSARHSASESNLVGVLRLTHMYFDEASKYRLVLYAYGCLANDAPKVTDNPLWCSKVVYDAARPERKCPATIAEVVRAAYRAAEQRGYALAWNDDPPELSWNHGGYRVSLG